MPRQRNFLPDALTAAIGLLAALAVACGGPPPGPAAEAETALERVVAEVNGVPILAGQVEKACEADRLLLGARGEEVAPEKSLELRSRALELIISGELVYQAARAEGLVVSADEIDSQLEVVRSQFASDDEFASYLETAGSSPERLRDETERRLLMEHYTERITGDLRIDESEARGIYDEEKSRFMGDEQIRAARILIRARSQDPPELRAEARARVEEARRRALAGEDFDALAREYSESPLASRGGDLGFFPRGRMLPEFEKAVFALPVGGLSPVFETPHGFNLVKVLERREAELRPFEEVKTELLMVLARERKDRALREHVEALREAAEVRILDPDLKLP